MITRHTLPVPRRLAVLLASSLLLTGCGLADARDSAVRLAAIKPFASTDTWLPGLAGVDGYGGKGLGPVGYANVSEAGGLGPTQTFLASLLLQKRDLTAGMKISLIPQGSSLAGATLDFCGADYPSESLRLARRQVAAYDASGNYAGISTEAVQYETTDAAQQALDEIVAQKAKCPDGTTYTDADGVAHRLTFFPAPAPNSTKVRDQHVVLHQVDKTDLGDLRSLLVWQVRGNVLLAAYFSGEGSEPFDQTSLDSIFALVTAFTERLQAADSVDVGEVI